MKKIAVIGGGASGLLASIYAASPNTEVTLFEKNNLCGKKLLMTGNGRCNLWNADQSFYHYHTSCESFLEKILCSQNQQEILHFFEQLGIFLKQKDGYFYPQSGQAQTIKEALVKEALRRNVHIVYQTEITKIDYRDFSFWILGQAFDRVILSTGSCAYPKTGSDGMGYVLLKSFHHTITPVLPALVSLKTKENFKELKGLRCDVQVSIFENQKSLQTQRGEILFTDYGVSGICIFNLSRYASIGLQKKKKVNLQIHFIPFLEKDFISYVKEKRMFSVSQVLDGMLPYKLTNFLLKKIKLDRERLCLSLSNTELELLYQNLTQFSCEVVGTLDFSFAQVATGGVPLNEITETFESKKQEHLFITGELLDIDGECGGYNLSLAWLSGMIAGKNAQK